MSENILDVFNKNNYPDIDAATAGKLDAIYNEMIRAKAKSHVFSSLLDAYQGNININNDGGISASRGSIDFNVSFSNALSLLVDALAHELGHELAPGGSVDNVKSSTALNEAIEKGRRAEGIATFIEILVSLELGINTTSISENSELFNKVINAIGEDASQYLINSSALNDLINRSSSIIDEIGQYYGSEKFSNQALETGLVYDDFYSLIWLSSKVGIPINPDSFTSSPFTLNADNSKSVSIQQTILSQTGGVIKIAVDANISVEGFIEYAHATERAGISNALIKDVYNFGKSNDNSYKLLTLDYKTGTGTYSESSNKEFTFEIINGMTFANRTDDYISMYLMPGVSVNYYFNNQPTTTSSGNGLDAWTFDTVGWSLVTTETGNMYFVPERFNDTDALPDPSELNLWEQFKVPPLEGSSREIDFGDVEWTEGEKFLRIKDYDENGQLIREWGASRDLETGGLTIDWGNQTDGSLDPAAPQFGGGGAANGSGNVGDGIKKTSPLVLDLNGNGINLTSLAWTSPYFDLDNSGFAHKTGWIGEGAGLLAFDQNGNGVIDTGTELFGTAGGANDGFEALRSLDTNHDNIINTNDAAFSQLRIWVDPDGDGITDTGELLTLEQLGILSINLNATTVTQTNAGNSIELISNFTLADGTQHTIADVYFANSLTFTRPDVSVSWSSDVTSLPQLLGYGSLVDLRSAATTNETLKAEIQNLVTNIEQDPALTMAAIKTLLLEWSQSTTIDPVSRGGVFDARKLDFLEKYTGIEFYNQLNLTDWIGQPTFPRWRSAISLEEGWNNVYDSIVARLLLQSGYQLPEFTYNQADDMVLPSKTWLNSLANLFSRLGDISEANALEWEIALRVADAFRLDARVSPEAYLESIANATSDSIAAIASALIYGQSFNIDQSGITLSGPTENAILYTGSNVRVIHVNGEPSLTPPPLNNVIVYDAGNGAVEIDQSDYSQTPHNVLRLGTSITPSNVSVSADRFGNLFLTDGISGDQIKIDKALSNTAYGVQSVEFLSDGTTWDLAYLAQQEMNGTAGADVLYGTSGANVLDGQAGNDDVLGNDGNDTITGSLGNDTLEGGNGNDTYLYSRGDGNDTIIEPVFGGSADKFVFENINASAVALVRNGLDVTLSIAESSAGAGDGGSVLLKDQLDDYFSRGVEQIVFADGTIWTASDLRANVLAAAATSGNDTIIGTSAADTLAGGQGNDRIEGLAGADTYIYNIGDGNDIIYDSGTSVGEIDKIIFGNGLNSAGAKVTWYSDTGEFILQFSGIEGSVTLNVPLNQTGTSTGIEQIVFGDGTLWSAVEIAAAAAAAESRTLEGTSGNDTLNGGLGNDRLKGGAGSDTYIYASGDGNDLIKESFASGTDTLKFTNINASGVTFAAAQDDYDDLIITVTSTGQTIRIDQQFAYSGTTNSGIDQIVFADGTTWNQSTFGALTSYMGTNDNDTMWGNSYANTLTGVLGNDTISGGAGSDTYIYASGDGNDLIKESFASGTDTLKFTNINASGVTFAAAQDDYDDLIITVTSTGQTIRIDQQFAYSGTTNSGIDQIVFADGTTWNQSTFGALTSYMGTNGNDTMWGNSYANTLTGGLGNDTISGGAGSDTYIYASGDGNDLIKESFASGTDTLKFTNINASDVTFAAAQDDYDDLIVTVTATGQTIRIDQQFAYSGTTNSGIDQIVFADGTIWNQTTFGALTTYTGTSGNDTMWGNAYANTLTGGLGDDTISGGAGSDTLNGGSGSDLLKGGSDNDTYVIMVGDGSDTITESSGNDVLKLLGGVDASDLWFARETDNLAIYHLGTTDKVNITGWFTSTANQVETIRTDASNKVLYAGDVNSLISQMASFSAQVGTDPSAIQPSQLPPEYSVAVNAVWHTGA